MGVADSNQTDINPASEVEKDESKRSTISSNTEHQNEELSTKESAETLSQPAEEYVTGLKLWLLFAPLVCCFFLVLLDMSIIGTAIPTITSHFHALNDVGWYANVYQLASSALQPLTGKIYSNFNSKWSFLSFFALFELGSLLCGVATSSKMLIVGRAVAGMGTSGLQNGALTIIAQSAPMEKRPALMGILVGFSQIGLIVGPLLGGAFTQYVSWRWCFYINLPIGAVVAVLLFFLRVPEPIKKPKAITILPKLAQKLDLFGFFLFAPAAIQVLLALEWGGNQYPWNSSTIIGLFCGGGATFLVFLLWEHRIGDAAMIPLSMISKRVIWASCLNGGTIMALVLCGNYYLPIYFQAVKNASPTMSGVYLLPSILTQILFTVSSGILVGKLGYYLPAAVLSGILMSVGHGLLSLLRPHSSTGEWVGYQILTGAGRGAGFQIPIIAIQNGLPQAEIPIGMALAMFTNNFSGSVFISIAETIFSNSLTSNLAKYAPSVNAEVVVATGAASIRKMFSGDELAGVIMAYCKSVDAVFYLAVGLGVGGFLTAWGLGWKDVRKAKKPANEKAKTDADAV